ncbi:transporter [Nonlabens ponticola]|uniref:Transporter n=1 Tax=Nonlabens ponticola TaxID=2496866 RepID=A0A3S9MV11_9FLAO|nr:transporter [Nonlabens ponticola]AZQ43008.1 transporter [Nonlabens ponticola]
MKKIIYLSALLISLQLVAQQEQINPDGALVTDRPDATESPSVVRPGYLQIETGGFYTENEENGTTIKETTYNTTLLRYGVMKNVELRLGLDYRNTQFGSSDNDLNGLSPLLLGAKIGIAQEDGWKPQMALLGHLTLPYTASSDYDPEATGMDFRFAFNHTLSDRSGIAYNLGARLDAGNPELAYLYTVAYGYSLTNTIGAYVELYGDFPTDSSANHLWDAGFTYLANNDLQFDVTVGSGITDGQDILLSAGLSYRIRKKQ